VAVRQRVLRLFEGRNFQTGAGVVS